MNKFHLALILLVLLACSMLSVSTINLGKAENGTQVSGIITTNTIWSQSNSPYIFSGPVAVASGVTLTIEAGVTVNMGAHYLKVNGTLNARGTDSEKITFNSAYTSIYDSLGFTQVSSGVIVFTSVSTSWDDATSLGSIIENAVISTNQDVACIEITSCSPKIDDCMIIAPNSRGTISLGSSLGPFGDLDVSTMPIISNNDISGGTGLRCGSGHALITDNVIHDCDLGLYIYGGEPVFQRNVIMNNIGPKINGEGGIRVDYDYTKPVFINNTITKNTVGFNIINNPVPTIIGNSIFDNNEYNIYLYQGYSPTTVNVNATYNWWGTIDTQAINQTNFDFKNDFNLGNVLFTPFLTSPNPDAPIPPEPTPTPTPTPKTYSLTILHIGEGTVTPVDGIHSINSPITLTASPATNYEFMCWLENGTVLSTTNPYSYTPANDFVITAVFYDPVAKATSTPLPTQALTSNPTSQPTSNPTANPTTSNTEGPVTTPSPTSTIPELSMLFVIILIVIVTLPLATLKKKNSFCHR